jgi:hypothetical protein
LFRLEGYGYGDRVRGIGLKEYGQRVSVRGLALTLRFRVGRPGLEG